MPVQIKTYSDFYEPPEAIYTCDSCGCHFDEDDLPEGLDGDEVYCLECLEELREEEIENQKESENGSNLHSNTDFLLARQEDNYKNICFR